MELIEEKIILKNLITSDLYFFKVFPFLSEKLFSKKYTRKIFQCIKDYNEKYNRKPTLPVMNLFVEEVKGVSEDDLKDISEAVEFFNKEEEYNFDWLCDKTLDFIHSRTYFEAIADAAEKYEKGKLDTELSTKLDAALSITFDNEIGMSFDDAEKRWEQYTLKEDQVPFLVEQLNEATKGGITRKTLNCLMSSNTGGFKSGTMCSLSCDYLRQGYNVLYLTFEMAENKILERIDANMLDIQIDDLINLGKDGYLSRINKIKNVTNGKFIVKQFPTSMCHVGHIRYLLKELKLKSHFVPDIIIFDYLGIMASTRYKDAPEHLILKSVCEEVRGLCVEYNVIGWTAMQSNRSGASAGADLSISDISASYGTVFGFDLLWGLVTTPEFDADHKILFRQLKNRYSDLNMLPKFFLGINKGKMKVFDYINTSQQNYNFDVSPQAEQENEDAQESIFASRFTKNRTTVGNSFKFG